MEDKLLAHTAHADNCALIIPRETGVVYQHQTGGMMCGQANFEGIMLPIKRAWMIDDELGYVDLMDELRRYDYPVEDNNTELEWESREELWSEIEDQLPFHFEILDPEEIPEGCPKTGAWEWIEVQGEKTRDDGRSRMPIDDWADDLQGEKAVLLYPNCD